MSENIILNRIERIIQEQYKYIDYCKEQIKYLSHPEDIKVLEDARNNSENIVCILQKIKRHKDIPLRKNYL